MANSLSLTKLDVLIRKRDCHKPAKSVMLEIRKEKHITYEMLLLNGTLFS